MEKNNTIDVSYYLRKLSKTQKDFPEAKLFLPSNLKGKINVHQTCVYFSDTVGMPTIKTT